MLAAEPLRWDQWRTRAVSDKLGVSALSVGIIEYQNLIRVPNNGLASTLRTRQQPSRVQDERHLGCDVDEGGKEWVEEAEAGKHDADRIDRNRAHEILPDDAPRAPGDRDRVGETDQVVAEQHDISALARHTG